MTPTDLIAVLAGIPRNHTLVKSGYCTGNLAILDPVGNYVGYVDLATGEIDLFDAVRAGDRTQP